MLAALRGHMEIVQLLINAGATVNDKENHVQNQNSFSVFKAKRIALSSSAMHKKYFNQ